MLLGIEISLCISGNYKAREAVHTNGHNDVLEESVEQAGVLGEVKRLVNTVGTYQRTQCCTT